MADYNHNQKKKCFYCNIDFNIINRKRRCRKCNNYCCFECCCIKVSYPISYNFSCPQWACNNCLPDIFNSRSNDCNENENEIIKSNSPALIDGSFHTSYESPTHIAFKIADPFSRLFFRFSGMYNGGNFNRSKLEKARKLNKVVVKLPSVGHVERYSIPVPINVYSNDWEFNKIYKHPPFIKHNKNEEKQNKLINSNIDNDIIQEEEILESEKSKEWDEINVLVYEPKNRKENEYLPILIWYHGGGFCMGSMEDAQYETICRTFCNKINCIVVSVEYRLAPEFKFPVPIEDAYWALLWTEIKAKNLFMGDISRISVAGDSAGGSLAALMCIMSKIRNGPKIIHQTLIYPCLANPCNDRYESQIKYKNGPLLSRSVMEWLMKQVLGDSHEEPEYLFPLLLDDNMLKDLPSTTIINAQHDPLLDHGKEYFKRLKNLNIKVSHSIYSTSIHGFFASKIGESEEAIMEVIIALKEVYKRKKEEDKKED